MQTEKLRKELKLGSDGSYKISEVKKKDSPQVVVGWYTLFAKGSGLGLSLALPMVIFTLIGVFADKQFAMKPTFTIIGFIVGTILGIFSFARNVKELLRAGSIDNRTSS